MDIKEKLIKIVGYIEYKNLKNKKYNNKLVNIIDDILQIIEDDYLNYLFDELKEIIQFNKNEYVYDCLREIVEYLELEDEFPQVYKTDKTNHLLK